MVNTIWQFILDIPKNLGPFGEWLFTPIELLNIAPIAIFGITGFSVIFALHVVHLVNVIGG